MSKALDSVVLQMVGGDDNPLFALASSVATWGRKSGLSGSQLMFRGGGQVIVKHAPEAILDAIGAGLHRQDGEDSALEFQVVTVEPLPARGEPDA